MTSNDHLVMALAPDQSIDELLDSIKASDRQFADLVLSLNLELAAVNRRLLETEQELAAVRHGRDRLYESYQEQGRGMAQLKAVLSPINRHFAACPGRVSTVLLEYQKANGEWDNDSVPVEYFEEALRVSPVDVKPYTFRGPAGES